MNPIERARLRFPPPPATVTLAQIAPVAPSSGAPIERRSRAKIAERATLVVAGASIVFWVSAFAFAPQRSRLARRISNAGIAVTAIVGGAGLIWTMLGPPGD